ncbi:hypothetical protein QQ045_002229 [Rhodiola kirilowii]
MDELISPADHHAAPGKDQQAAGVGILLQIMMLVLSFVLGHVLRRRKFYYLPEASASLLIETILFKFWGYYDFRNLGNFYSSSCNRGFGELGTDVNLYALVFGESVLNDAMAISLYRTMALVRSSASSGQSFFMLVVHFLETFLGSMSAGRFIYLVYLYLQNLECCLVVLFPYFSYMLAEGIGLSGIVSILFTGIYTFSNLSENSQRFVSAFFHLISSLAETFVFIYMGFDIAMEQQSWSHVGFIFFSIIFIIIARAANIFSCGYLVNLFRPRHRKIPMKHQKALWYGGLRGAMAFALALQSVHDLPDGHGQTILTATTAIVVLTNIEETNGYLAHSYDYQDESSSSGNKIKMKLKEFHKSTASFTALDKNYLTPFFTNAGDEDDEDFDEPMPSSRRGGFYDRA